MRKNENAPIQSDLLQMPARDASGSANSLELWGGMECSLVRVGDAFHDQFRVGGHYERADADLRRIAEIGIRTLRYPVSWERICTDGNIVAADWAWTDARMALLRELGIRPIVTLVHHGSGPQNTSLIDPTFPERLAEFAHAAALRYPWVMDWTPVNEPLTTARFAGLYGHWYPHGKDERTFLTCLLNEIRGTVLAMRAIRQVIPSASLVQTEDLGKTYSTRKLAYQAEFENERRWLSFDLICGQLREGGSGERMWHHLRWAGIEDAALQWFVENPCPPNIVGINHYLTSERFLDHHIERYPAQTHGTNGRDPYADVEAVRVLGEGCAGGGPLLAEAWERYGLPVAITEAHLGCTREEQMRWLAEVWEEAKWARDQQKVDVRAVTVWSLFGAWDWDSLLTEQRGSYEPGVWDVRAQPEPRETGLATMVRALSSGAEPMHPTLDAPGWWRRPERLVYPANNLRTRTTLCRVAVRDREPRPILITGGHGTVGDALRRACQMRGLPCLALGRNELDITQIDHVARVLDEHRPWVVLNAAGYTRVDLAEAEPFECFRDNVKGPANLAACCVHRGVSLVLFSSALVFDGAKAPLPYVESDLTCPESIYGRSNTRMEEIVRAKMPQALILRSSVLFGPWDERNFLTRSLQALARGDVVYAATDDFITPAYLPDFADHALDLLLDGIQGTWHLFHPEPISRAELVERAAEMAGVDTSRLRQIERLSHEVPEKASYTQASSWAVLGSERSTPLLPTLEGALHHFAEHAASHWQHRPSLPPQEHMPLRRYPEPVRVPEEAM